MKIGTVSNLNAFKGAQEVSATTSSNEKKDIKEVVKENKGKIALGLGALAAAGIAAVAISRGKKVPSELGIDDFKKIGKFNKGVATVKGKPFSGMINVVNKEKGSKYVLEYTDGALKSSTCYHALSGKPLTKKVYTKKDGVKTIESFVNSDLLLIFDKRAKKTGETRWLPNGVKMTITDNKVTKEYNSILGATSKYKNYYKYYILTKDEAGNVIAKKPVYSRKPAFSLGETFLKQAEKYTDEDGNKVVETLKNGKPFTRQTTKMADDGSRQIVVEYLDKGSEGYKKIIDITKDGKRTIRTKGEHIFKF